MRRRGEVQARAMVAGGFGVLGLLVAGVLGAIGAFLSAPSGGEWIPRGNPTPGGYVVLAAVWIVTPPLLLACASAPALALRGGSFRAAAACGALSLFAGFSCYMASSSWSSGLLAALVVVPAVSSACAVLLDLASKAVAGQAGLSRDARSMLAWAAWTSGACAATGAVAWLAYTAGGNVLAYCVALAGWVAIPGVAGWALEDALAGPQGPGSNGKSPGSSTSDVDE